MRVRKRIGSRARPRSERRSLAYWLVLIQVMSVASCTGTVEVPDSQEAVPLFRQIDAKVAKSFATKARLTEVETALFRAEVGAISVGRFDQAFDAMFTETTVAPNWPPWQRVDMNHVDGIVQLEEAIAELKFDKIEKLMEQGNLTYKQIQKHGITTNLFSQYKKMKGLPSYLE